MAEVQDSGPVRPTGVRAGARERRARRVSPRHQRSHRAAALIPAPAGMAPTTGNSAGGCPRTCGDGPPLRVWRTVTATCSPHLRGWSLRRTPAPAGHVNCALVGLPRRWARCLPLLACAGPPTAAWRADGMAGGTTGVPHGSADTAPPMALGPLHAARYAPLRVHRSHWNREEDRMTAAAPPPGGPEQGPLLTAHSASGRVRRQPLGPGASRPPSGAARGLNAPQTPARRRPCRTARRALAKARAVLAVTVDQCDPQTVRGTYAVRTRNVRFMG